MSLNKAALRVQFQGGLDLRSDEKTVAFTQLLDLRNAVFGKQTTLQKRNGHAALSQAIQGGAGLYSGAVGLAQRDSEILLFNASHAYSYRPSSGEWADTGEVIATTCTTRPIARSGTQQSQPDVAERHGIRIVAWEDSRGGIRCSVLETDTGHVLQSQVAIDASSNAISPRCVAVGEVLQIIWLRPDLGQINIAVINPNAPYVAPATSVLTSDLATAAPWFDAESAPAAPSGSFDARPAVMVWAQAGGGFRVAYLVASGSFGSPATSLPSVVTFSDSITGPLAISYSASDASVAVAWIGDATGTSVVRVRILAASTLAVSATVDPAGAAPPASGLLFRKVTLAFGAVGASGKTELWWAAELSGARTDLCRVEWGGVDIVTGAITVQSEVRGHCLASRAWHAGGDPSLGVSAQGGHAYVAITHAARFFPYVAAVRISSNTTIGVPLAAPVNAAAAVIAARLLPGESSGQLMRPVGAGVFAWTQHLPSAMNVDLAEDELFSTERAVPLPYRIQLDSENGDQFSEQGIKFASISFDAGYASAQLGRGLYLSSACPQHYDGEAWHESDFHAAPDIGYDAAGVPVALSTLFTPTAGGNIANGSYEYAFWYESTDAQGELHRGAVSDKVLVTMTGGPRSFSITVPTCRLTKFANSRVCVARSAQGATGTDSTIELFRVTSNDVTVLAGSNRYLFNDPTADSVTFVDGLDDATLETREPLYTNGGILSNDPAPWAGGIIATGKGRLFWSDPTDPNVFRYSQQIADDTGIEAPVGLSAKCDPFGGDITAIAVMDDAVYVAKETAWYVVGGPGPLADPTVSPDTNSFTSPELVTSDVGCTSPQSIGQTPLGITFATSKGIKLLARGRSIVDIGKPVEPLKTQHYTRATLLPDRQAIVYLTDTPDGFSLYWDYQRDQWSKFENHLGIDAVVVNGTYNYLRTDGRVFVETPGVYSDDGAHIRMRIETAHLHLAAQLQGWQKIINAFFLGNYISPHQLSMSYRLNYDAGYSEPLLIDVNANFNPALYGVGLYGAGPFDGSGSDTTRYQRSVHINRRCQSISFLIQDVELATDFGASFELTELLLIGGGLGSSFPIGSARSQ